MTRMIQFAIASIIVPVVTFGGDSHATTAALATELAKLLAANGMDAVAAADPEQTGRFVAALYVPGSQLLVVSAKHPSVDALNYRISARAYRDVYLDLQGTPSPSGKLFVLDAGGDGLFPAGSDDGAVDVVYVDGVQTLRLNGQANAQSLTAAEYDRAFRSADERYAHALTVLTSALVHDDATRVPHP